MFDIKSNYVRLIHLCSVVTFASLFFPDFDQSGFGQGGGFNTPQADDKKRSVKRSNNIVPVTIAQIFTAKQDDDIFVSGNLELSQITFVGVIKSVSASSTRIDYTVDDMSGPPIEAKHFNARDDGDQEEGTTDSASAAIPVNTYVRVNGRVRSFGGKRSVNIHKINPLSDMNELSCHILEVMHAAAKSKQQQNQIAPVLSNSKGIEGMDTGNAGQNSGLTPLQSQIYNIIKSNHSEQGCSVDEICQNLRSAAPKAIRDAVEFLSCEGHVYSTIDEEHYQATDY